MSILENSLDLACAVLAFVSNNSALSADSIHHKLQWLRGRQAYAWMKIPALISAALVIGISQSSTSSWNLFYRKGHFLCLWVFQRFPPVGRCELSTLLHGGVGPAKYSWGCEQLGNQPAVSCICWGCSFCEHLRGAVWQSAASPGTRGTSLNPCTIKIPSNVLTLGHNQAIC